MNQVSQFDCENVHNLCMQRGFINYNLIMLRSLIRIYRQMELRE
jgi:hypothetical protein